MGGWGIDWRSREGAGVDPGFLERRFVCINIWDVRIAHFITFFLNIS